jgi:hypothetical protein
MSRETRSSAKIVAAAILLFGVAAIFRLIRDGSAHKPQATQIETAATNAPASSTAKTSLAVDDAQRQSLLRLENALQEIYSEGDALKREALLEAWLKEVALGEIPALVDFLDQDVGSPLRHEIIFRLFRKLSETEPETAAHLAEQRPESPERLRLLNVVAINWAARNLAETAAWARQLPEADRAGVMTKVAYEAVGQDLTQALELARELPADDNRNELITHIAGEWSVKNPEKIAEWAGKLEDETLRQQVISRVAAAWGDTNPSAAAELAIKSLPAGKPQDDAVVGIVQRWGQTKPADAGAWVAQFPEGPLRETAAEELVKLWADKNTPEAGVWLNSLPTGPTRDAAASAYVGKILHANPTTAAQWATQIANESLRNSVMERVASSWMPASPAAARAWISQSTLPDDVKQRLTESKAE